MASSWAGPARSFACERRRDDVRSRSQRLLLPPKLPIARVRGRVIVQCSTRAYAPPQDRGRQQKGSGPHVERERSHQVAGGPGARLRALHGGGRGGGAAAASGQVGRAQGGG